MPIPLGMESYPDVAAVAASISSDVEEAYRELGEWQKEVTNLLRETRVPRHDRFHVIQIVKIALSIDPALGDKKLRAWRAIEMICGAMEFKDQTRREILREERRQSPEGITFPEECSEDLKFSSESIGWVGLTFENWLKILMPKERTARSRQEKLEAFVSKWLPGSKERHDGNVFSQFVDPKGESPPLPQWSDKRLDSVSGRVSRLRDAFSLLVKEDDVFSSVFLAKVTAHFWSWEKEETKRRLGARATNAASARWKKNDP